MGAALLGSEWPKFTATDAQWHVLEEALGKTIRAESREQICDLTSRYVSDGNAERNALFRDEYKKTLAEIGRIATRLDALLFHGTTQLQFHAAEAALAGLDEFVPETDDDESVLKALHHAPYVEPNTVAFENALQRVANNCNTEIRRADKPGFIEREAWGAWISALLTIQKEAGLPHGLSTLKDKGNVSAAVLFVAALQHLLAEPLRVSEHSMAALTKAMQRARQKTRKPKRLSRK
jgi:hypothetical protein